MVQDTKTVRDGWLSDQIGRSAYCLKGEIAPADLDRLPSKGLFAYAKIETENVALVRKYLDLGFRVVDCAIFLRQPPLIKTVKIPNDLISVRSATPDDEEPVVKISTTAFQYSRFHLDPEFDSETANRIKGEWVRNYFRGKRGDALSLVTVSGEIVGFSLMVKNSERWQIDLIGVLAQFRGRGVGSALISDINRELGALEVGTQVSNVASLKLYQNAAFVVQGSKYVLHFHR